MQKQHDATSHQGSSPPFFTSALEPEILEAPAANPPPATVSQSNNSIKFLCYRQPMWSCDSQTLLEEAGFQPEVRFYFKSLEFLHYSLFLNLELTAVFFIPISSGPLRA